MTSFLVAILDFRSRDCRNHVTSHLEVILPEIQNGDQKGRHKLKILAGSDVTNARRTPKQEVNPHNPHHVGTDKPKYYHHI